MEEELLKLVNVELLGPAGNFEKLKYAIHYGADAVYFSGKKYGLRAGAGNFSNDEIPQALKYIHDHGKKGYVTLNIFAHNTDLDGFGEYVQFLVDAGIDAVIVADYGIFYFIRKNFPNVRIHISTQANVTNLQAVKFWEELGAKRITLARELSLKEIEEIRKNSSIELEVFAHGAMCMSYSGRCLLSNYLTGRDANQGDCSHVCRWEFKLTGVKRDGVEIEGYQDERGTYLLNSNDLWTIPILDEILNLEIDSIKIEGRMKSVHYVSNVTKAYRQAIDAYNQGRLTDALKNKLMNELKKTSHRNFFTGFYEKKPGSDSHNFESSKYRADYTMVGVVKEIVDKKAVVIECRASFDVHEELMLITPDQEDLRIVLSKAMTVTGEKVQRTKPNQIIVVSYNKKLKIHGILAKKKKQERTR